MKVLFPVSECVPFLKTGGLADVAGALPKELRKLGTDIRVIMPKYAAIPGKYKSRMKRIAEFTVRLGWRNQPCGIDELFYNGIHYYFIENAFYFNRDRIYGCNDDGERFAFFNRAVLESFQYLGFYPEILHCHDWHTGMLPFLLRAEYDGDPQYKAIRTVFTIHNLQFQGLFPQMILGDVFGLSDEYFHPDYLELHGKVSFMKGALVSSDRITTVSPTYRNEIQTRYYGEGLHGLLEKRANDLTGIINGIDECLYDPASDCSLYKNYQAEKTENKQVNKREIQGHFGLPEQSSVPLLAMVTRLTGQKGLDLVTHVFQEIMAERVQMIILGTGEPKYEHFFREMEKKYSDQFKVFVGFDETLARKIYAGADLFLMPSQFEPCGLSQLIAMRYGSIPIVRETGGLNDTVEPFNQYTLEGNGFSFRNYNAHEMLDAIRRAIYVYQQEEIWAGLVQSAMTVDYGWSRSAKKYHRLYKELIMKGATACFPV